MENQMKALTLALLLSLPVPKLAPPAVRQPTTHMTQHSKGGRWYFAATGHVVWSAMLPLAIGLLAGGRLGPVILRRAPARPLQLAIGLAGLGLAASLAFRAYR